AYDYSVPSRGKCVCLTDIQIAVPDGCYGRVAPRSGLAAKHFIDVGAGVIDQDYRGNVGVVLFNFGDTDFKVSKGDRIAQLVCEKIAYPTLEEAEVTLNPTVHASFGTRGVERCDDGDAHSLILFLRSFTSDCWELDDVTRQLYDIVCCRGHTKRIDRQGNRKNSSYAAAGVGDWFHQ
ncbi:hypothetical protein HPB47_008681, partial [Ixodes persulcatus]